MNMSTTKETLMDMAEAVRDGKCVTMEPDLFALVMDLVKVLSDEEA